MIGQGLYHTREGYMVRKGYYPIAQEFVHLINFTLYYSLILSSWGKAPLQWSGISFVPVLDGNITLATLNQLSSKLLYFSLLS